MSIRCGCPNQRDPERHAVISPRLGPAGSGRDRWRLVAAAALAALLAGGCSTAEERALSRIPVPYAALPNGNDPLNPGQLLPGYTSAQVATARGVIPYFERKRGHPLQILALSGGGQNGKSQNAPSAVRNDILGIAGSSLDVMLTNSMEALLVRAYIAARAHGYRFRMISIPEAVDIGHNALAFDPAEMSNAFDAGYALGRSDAPWAAAPPFVNDLPKWALDLVQPAR
jgi:hypothetical protein